ALVLEDDGALLHDDGGDAPGKVDGGEDAGEVPPAVAPADDAEPRAVQLDLADGLLAVEQLFLVEVNHRGGDVEEVGLVEVVAAGQARRADVEAAGQAEPGRLDADAGADEVPGELVEALPTGGGGVGEVLVEQYGRDRECDEGEDQASDEPFPPGHDRLSAIG